MAGKEQPTPSRAQTREKAPAATLHQEKLLQSQGLHHQQLSSESSSCTDLLRLSQKATSNSRAAALQQPQPTAALWQSPPVPKAARGVGEHRLPLDVTGFRVLIGFSLPA